MFGGFRFISYLCIVKQRQRVLLDIETTSAILPQNHLNFKEMSKTFGISELGNAVVNVFDTIAFCKEMSLCKFGYAFVARSTPKFRAPKATAVEWVEQFGNTMPSVVKITKVTNAKAYDYEDAVNRQLTKQGDAADFKSDALNGYDWVVPNVIKRAQKDGSLQLTLLFKDNDKTTFETFYIVFEFDGTCRFATEEETEFIKNHLYVAPNKSKKQSEMGIEDKDILQVRNYKFSNVIAVGKTPQIEEMWANIEK